MVLTSDQATKLIAKTMQICLTEKGRPIELNEEQALRLIQDKCVVCNIDTSEVIYCEDICRVLHRRMIDEEKRLEKEARKGK